MKQLITIFISCCFILLPSAQKESVLKISLVQKINEEVKDFTTDNLGNIYLLTATNQVKKLDQKGDSIGVYNDVKRYGRIYSIDATNPLKVLIYYKDFSTIVVLDRLLNPIATVDLRKQNILQARVVTTSYDNNIWVFDELDSKLKKIDDNAKLLFESTDFRQIFDPVPTPIAMYDKDGQLYLYDSLKGLLVFDYYGGKKNNLQLLHFKDLQVVDKNTITARNDTNIFLYKPATLQLLTFTAFLNQAIYKKINFNGSLLYCLTKQGELQIFQVLK